MPLRIEIIKVDAPGLEFGSPGVFADPKVGLEHAGPFDLRFGSAHKSQLRIGMIGTAESLDKANAWLTRCNGEIPLEEKETALRRTFPGFQRAFQCELVVNERWNVEINAGLLAKYLSKSEIERFKSILDIFSAALEKLKEPFKPDIALICLPDEVIKRSRIISRRPTKAERAALSTVNNRQYDLFPDWEPEEIKEDILTRDLRRALKARAIHIGLPTQIATDNLFLERKTNEDAATRAWNFCTGIYYKGGGLPWRAALEEPDTCFVGITFHHLRTNKRDLIYSSLAQAFSSRGEGFAVRGIALDSSAFTDKQVHLSEEQSEALGSKVLGGYLSRNGRSPARIVVHKSSRYDDAEIAGLKSAFSNIPSVELVTLIPSRLRLVPLGTYPPKRGTMFIVNRARKFLYLSGYLDEVETYPGPHIPSPVEFRTIGETENPERTAKETLGLGRMNWNTSSVQSSQPITLAFARRVGGILAELSFLSDADVEGISYRYFM